MLVKALADSWALSLRHSSLHLKCLDHRDSDSFLMAFYMFWVTEALLRNRTQRRTFCRNKVAIRKYPPHLWPTIQQNMANNIKQWCVQHLGGKSITSEPLKKKMSGRKHWLPFVLELCYLVCLNQGQSTIITFSLNSHMHPRAQAFCR